MSAHIHNSLYFGLDFALAVWCGLLGAALCCWIALAWWRILAVLSASVCACGAWYLVLERGLDWAFKGVK